MPFRALGHVICISDPEVAAGRDAGMKAALADPSLAPEQEAPPHLEGGVLGFHPAARNFSRSDHVNFWHAGLPAIHVTNTANFRNRHYHQTTDTPETLDYGTLARIGAATALLVEELAGIR